MKSILNIKTIAFLAIGMLFVSSCTNDQLPEPSIPESCEDTVPTYDVEIRPIIEESCAYAGCHLDGSAPGIYVDYEGVKSVIESGAFREKVVVQKDDPNIGMPPNYAPEGRPQDLTMEELDLIVCWLENGYPES
jgi:hypothetical protein